jgi:putative heme iron utilization protein
MGQEEHGMSDDQAAHESEGQRQARAPSHAERCRTLVSAARTATLSTLARDPRGYPFGSLVTLACDARGRPLLLLSSLAEHTQNLTEHSEASLLVSDHAADREEPLAAGRVTLLGRCLPVAASEEPEARACFLASHPGAQGYAGFADFAFYRLDPMALRYVGGFGRMSWVTAADYAAAEPDPLATSAAGILDHMNDDHADAVLAYAQAFAAIGDATAARMTAVDRYGFDLSATTARGPQSARLAFEAPVATSDEVRKALIALLREARARLAAGQIPASGAPR